LPPPPATRRADRHDCRAGYSRRPPYWLPRRHSSCVEESCHGAPFGTTNGRKEGEARVRRTQPRSGRTRTQRGDTQERGTEDPKPPRARRRGGGARPRSARGGRRTSATRCLRPPRGGPDAATPDERKIGHGRGGERAPRTQSRRWAAELSAAALALAGSSVAAVPLAAEQVGVAVCNYCS